MLLGRATFGNPYVLRKELSPSDPSLFAIALEHAYLFENIYQDAERYNFLPMRKHLGWYVKSVHNASEIRKKVFASESAQQVEEIFLEHGLVTEAEVTKSKQAEV